MSAEKGKMFLILGPSGSGKGTVIAHLRKVFPNVLFPISCTTRPPRPSEKNGDVYYFVTHDEFRKKIASGEFLEHAVVHHDNLYGTLKKPIMEALKSGQMVIREVDMQGVSSIRAGLPQDQVISIFLTVPTWEALRARILKRHAETDEELEQRRVSFEKEMAFSKTCDFVIENLDGEERATCKKVEDIIASFL